MIELWAEAGPCNKNIDSALLYAKAVAEAGASALKVQWYRPETTFTRDAPRYDNTGGSAKTQWEAAADPIYPYERWEPVIDFCRDHNIQFIPSVFDLEAVDVADKFELYTIKIASGDITYHELIRAAAGGRRIALSTGASTYDEIQAAVNLLDHEASVQVLMACHLEYPTPFHRANIARTYALQEAFPYMMPGFSDHTPGIETIPLIVATGNQVIEKHFTLEAGKGYDSDFALTPADLRNAVNKIEGTLAVMGDSAIGPDESEMPAREGARRSPYARIHIEAGRVIEADDLIILRPDYGLSPQEAVRYVGRSFEVDIPAGGQLPT